MTVHKIMTVHIRPEFEAIIAEDLKSGIDASAEEYIRRAIQLLHEERLGHMKTAMRLPHRLKRDGQERNVASLLTRRTQ